MSSKDQFDSPSQKFAESVKDKRSPDDPEVQIWKGSYSPKSMVGSWLIAGLLTIGLLILLMFTALKDYSIAWWIVWITIAAGWLFLIGLLFYRKLSMHYELTSQRLRHREGLLFRQLDRIELIHIADVTYRQGPIQAMLNVGEIKVKSSDVTHPVLTMYGIADVRTVADHIDNARRAERRKRAMHIESI